MAILLRPCWLLVAALVCLVCLFASADGFRLRDYDVDEDQRVSMAISKRKINHRRSAVDEVVKKRYVADNDEDDEDNDDNDGDDDDDEEEERAAESKYKFERVRRSYRSTPEQKRKAEVSKQREQVDTDKSVKRFKVLQPVRGVKQKVVVDDDDDDEDDDDEDEVDDEGDEDDDEEEEEKSVFNLFGLFKSKKAKEEDVEEIEEKPVKSLKKSVVVKHDDDDDEEDNDNDDDNDDEDEKEDSGWFGWLNRKDSDSDDGKDDKNKEADDKDDDDEKPEGWFGWLKSLTEKDDDDEKDKKTDDEDDDNDKEKENPLINLFSSLLSADKEETSEEITFRRVGSGEDDEDDSKEVKDKKAKAKKQKDSKIVQLLNASPLNNLFKPGDLPSESTIDTDPKKVKKLQQTPSKVVKQRIEISPEDFESLLLRIPSFVPDYSRIKNDECRRQGQIFQRQLRGKRLWALQMIDASAKLTSGLLRGNANQLGDFDLCTGIATKIKVKEDEQVKMRGKYCLAHVDVVAEDDNLKLPVHLLQGRGFIKSTLNDPDHFLPRFTTINWGICLPSACSYEDASSIVKHFVKPYNSTGLKLYLEIEEGNCHVRQTATWSKLFKENWQLVASL